MYFQIENTPEHIRRSRRKTVARKDSPKEECARLVLAPFSRPPQLLFDNVLLGETCRRELEVFNPSKQMQRITLGKALPPGFIIHLPNTWLEVEAETCYTLTMEWCPTQPTALKETIRFTNESRGRYDVNIILKSVMNIKGKVKGFKTSPGKAKKKLSKRSPVAIYKKKSEIIYNTTQIRKSVSMHNDFTSMKSSNKENISHFNEHTSIVQDLKCPFDSPTSIDLNFDTSEIFANMRKPRANILQHTYENLFEVNRLNDSVPLNVLKPSNPKVSNNSGLDMFDNLTFTPLKSLASIKSENLEKVPKIVLSMDSDSELDDSLNVKKVDKDNELNSIIHISSQPPNNWLNVNHHFKPNNEILKTPHFENKKIPNTSSPKELNSPNFTINTELSRISDLSFAPQRFSTDRKNVVKINNTHDLFDDKLNSDTYTKESPNTPLFAVNLQTETRPPHYFSRDNPKICKQVLFREYKFQDDSLDKCYLQPVEQNVFQDTRRDMKTSPRSLSPQLQSIPEESLQLTDARSLDDTDKQSTFTINRTFEKIPNRNSVSNISTWSRKASRADPEIWKVPVAVPKKSLKPKKSLASKDSSKELNGFDKSMNQNVSLNHVGNVYSQSFTVDPFSSSTYFYDEEAVEKIEKEFKRWLNYILTPPADLDSNIEQKVDVGKAWLENRNKEIPAAPTKEYVSSVYHNSHRLESLRKAAKALLLNPDIVKVIMKLNAQIEKKLIAIRSDRMLHLDVGLQKIIMELLLAYNPLWLRIGLEAIYNVVLPLKSNSDIDGLSTFIIQRMFKNPNLKNKHSKSSAPNMLLPAYIEAVKKFTLKKFFLLVFFLDQAKQRKLIPHDPCLFCRNAICKESREIIIRFTRELIAGIGDITKHLRPLGYVVSHKQTYLDEYKYAVHNIAVDIRDGVRLTKVMEIILIKNGLLNQLRTPAISRLQKIHNVQVALNALKEANFEIAGDINANDIADGHREKTLSLLWQIIHVFRAPLFEKAAIVIQTWWKKKYEIIIEKRKQEERVIQLKNKAASTIQWWWRRIQYNRLVEWQMVRVTTATTIIQKYCRMWLCRTRLRKLKQSVVTIENWYRSIKLLREAKETLQTLKSKRNELRQKSATVIQSHIRRWLCVRHYKKQLKRIVLIQKLVRQFIARRKYKQLQNVTVYIQKMYRGKLLMRKEMALLNLKRKSAVVIQSFFRMTKQRKVFLKLKQSVRKIEESYIAQIKMRRQLEQYRVTKKVTIKLQSLYRGKKARAEYLRTRDLIIKLQTKFRAYSLMKKERQRFIEMKNAGVLLQKRIRAYLTMRKIRTEYLIQRKSAILIQQFFRAYLEGKKQRNYFVQLKTTTIIIQNRYRSLREMRKERSSFLTLKKYTICIQRQFRAQILMKKATKNYESLRLATIYIQEMYRGKLLMRKEMASFNLKRKSAVVIQSFFRMSKQRKYFLHLKQSVRTIEERYIALIQMREQYKQYRIKKEITIKLQSLYRGKKCRVEYLRTRDLIIKLQTKFRAHYLMKKERQRFIQIKSAAVLLQKRIRAYLTMRKIRTEYLIQRKSAILIQQYFRAYLEGKKQRNYFVKLKTTTIIIQNRYRSLREMRKERSSFLTLKKYTICIQRQFRAQILMKKATKNYESLRLATIYIQEMYRGKLLMRKEMASFNLIRKSAVVIQSFFRMSKQRKYFLHLKQSIRVIEERYIALIQMREQFKQYRIKKEITIRLQSLYRGKKCRAEYLRMRDLIIKLQTKFRAHYLMKKERQRFIHIKNAAVLLQKRIRAYLTMRKIRTEYLIQRKSAILIQQYFRAYLEGKKQRNYFVKLKRTTIIIQNRYRCLRKLRQEQSRFLLLIIKLQALSRGYLVRKQVQLQKEEMLKRKEEEKRQWAASKIQALFRGHKTRLARAEDTRVAELRRRWRDGALKSEQQSFKERNDEVLDLINCMSDIETIIRVFRSLALLTEVMPMTYNNNASSIVRCVYRYMSAMNRSISSIEVLKYAASILVNLTRYRFTGPKVYKRERIPPILRYMLRFSNSETHLFCILATYLWLFAKYDAAREDLTAFLHIPEHHKILITIKSYVERMKRMESKSRTKFNTPQSIKFVSHTGNMNYSICSTSSSVSKAEIILPALEPDYGIIRVDKPRYFEDPLQAITCLFHTYQL